MAVNQQGDKTTRKAEFTTFQAVLEKLMNRQVCLGAVDGIWSGGSRGNERPSNAS